MTGLTMCELNIIDIDATSQAGINMYPTFSQIICKIVILISRTTFVSARKEISSLCRNIAVSYFQLQLKYCSTFIKWILEGAFLFDISHEYDQWYT